MPTPATAGGSTSVGSDQNGPKRPKKAATAKVRKIRIPNVLPWPASCANNRNTPQRRRADHVPLALLYPVGAEGDQDHHHHPARIANPPQQPHPPDLHPSLLQHP